MVGSFVGCCMLAIKKSKEPAKRCDFQNNRLPKTNYNKSGYAKWYELQPPISISMRCAKSRLKTFRFVGPVLYFGYSLEHRNTGDAICNAEHPRFVCDSAEDRFMVVVAHGFEEKTKRCVNASG
eukprot:2689267-Amphidinium_carterae.1